MECQILPVTSPRLLRPSGFAHNWLLFECYRFWYFPSFAWLYKLKIYNTKACPNKQRLKSHTIALIAVYYVRYDFRKINVTSNFTIILEYRVNVVHKCLLVYTFTIFTDSNDFTHFGTLLLHEVDIKLLKGWWI